MIKNLMRMKNIGREDWVDEITQRAGPVDAGRLAVRTETFLATIGLHLNVHAIGTDARVAVIRSASTKERADIQSRVAGTGVRAVSQTLGKDLWRPEEEEETAFSIHFPHLV